MIKILFVCLGNICRSPAAEFTMKKLIKDKNLSDKIIVDSAGISSWHIGELPDFRMRKAAAKRQLILDSKARQFNSEDLEKFDYIIAMDRENLEAIFYADKKNRFSNKILLFTNFLDGNTKYKNGIPDPYELGPKAFELVLDLVYECCNNFLKKIIEEHNF